MDVQEKIMREANRELRPGSDEALEAGCQCAVLDNGHGKGWMGIEGVYSMNGNCPLHGVKVMKEVSDG